MKAAELCIIVVCCASALATLVRVLLVSKADLLLLGKLLAGDSGHLADRLQSVLNHSTHGRALPVLFIRRGLPLGEKSGSSSSPFCEFCLKTAFWCTLWTLF